jgi:hypothetical protein
MEPALTVTAILRAATLSTTATLKRSFQEDTWATHLAMAAIIPTIAWQCRVMPLW